MRGGGALVTALVLGACSDARSEQASALVRDVHALVTQPRLRPVHLEPELAGTFADHVDAPLGALRPLYGEELTRLTTRDAQSILDGAPLFEDLPEPWTRAEERTRELVAKILEATRAEGGRVPDALQTFAAYDPAPKYFYSDVQLAARLASLGMARVIAEGRADEAITSCTGALALARDISTAGMLGAMVGVSVVSIVREPCFAVLRAASPVGRLELLRQLGVVISGWPSLSVALGVERTFLQIIMLDPADRAWSQLPPVARFMRRAVNDDDDLLTGLRLSLFGQAALKRHLSGIDAARDAVELPPAEADARLAEIANEPRWMATLAWGDDTPPSWPLYARRARGARAVLYELDVVVRAFAFRDTSARWPSSLRELGVSSQDPLTGGEVSLVVAEDEVTLAFPVSELERGLVLR